MGERGPGTAAGRALDVERLARVLKERYGDAAFGLAVGTLTLQRFRADAEQIIARLMAEAGATAAVPEAPYDTEKGPTTQQVADSRFLERERASECDHSTSSLIEAARREAAAMELLHRWTDDWDDPDDPDTLCGACTANPHTDDCVLVATRALLHDNAGDGATVRDDG